MAQKTINNGDSGLAARTAINDNFTELYNKSKNFIVAASDSVNSESADFICNGSNDEITIQSAINSLLTKTVNTTFTPLFEVVNNCDSLTGWAALNTETVTLDNTDYHEGTGSIKVVGDANDNPGAKLTFTADDFSDYSHIEFYIKSDAADFVRVTLKTSGVKYAVYEKRISTAGQYNYIEINLEKPDVDRFVDLSSIVEIDIQVLTETDNYTFRIDSLNVNKYIDLNVKGISGNASVSGSAENTDYKISYQHNQIAAIVGGNLTSGASYNLSYSNSYGGEVKLLEGNYEIDASNTIIVPSNCKLTGSGFGTVLNYNYTGTFTDYVISASNSYGVIVSDLTINCNYDNGGSIGHGVVLTECSASKIKDCQILDNSYHFIGLKGSDNIIVDGNRLRNVNNSLVNHGIDLDISDDRAGCEFITIKNNDVNNQDNESIRVENSRHIEINGNTIYSDVIVSTNDPEYLQIEDVYIYRNTFLPTKETPESIITIGQTYGYKPVVIKSNKFNVGGIGITSPSGVDVVIDNNDFYDLKFRGVNNNGSTVDITILRNRFNNTRDYSIHSDSGAQNILIGDNKFYNNVASCIYLIDNTGEITVEGNESIGCSAIAFYINNSDFAVIKGNTAKQSTLQGFYIANSDNIIVDKNLALGGETTGIYLPSITNSFISNNAVISNTLGLYLNGGGGNHISNNTIIGNSTQGDNLGTGLYIYNSSNNNYIIGNYSYKGDSLRQKYGIRLRGCSGNVLVDNFNENGGQTSNYIASEDGNISYITNKSAAKNYVQVPIQLKEYAKASLPNAATFVRNIIWVTDDVGGETLAYSNGTNWLRVSDGSVIS